MAVKWESLIVPVAFSWRGQDCTIKYKPALANQTWMEKVANDGKIVEVLPEIVAWVDVTDDSGKNLSPTTLEGWQAFFQAAPRSFVAAAWGAVWEDMFPDKSK